MTEPANIIIVSSDSAAFCSDQLNPFPVKQSGETRLSHPKTSFPSRLQTSAQLTTTNRRVEKYFIRASVEAVTAQIHPSESTHRHSEASEVGGRSIGGGARGGCLSEAAGAAIAVELQPTFIWSFLSAVGLRL